MSDGGNSAKDDEIYGEEGDYGSEEVDILSDEEALNEAENHGVAAY